MFLSNSIQLFTIDETPPLHTSKSNSTSRLISLAWCWSRIGLLWLEWGVQVTPNIRRWESNTQSPASHFRMHDELVVALCGSESHKRQLHDTVSRPVEWCLTAKEEPGSKIKGPTHFDAGIKNGNPPGNRTKLSRVDTRYMCIHVKYMYMYTSQDEWQTVTNKQGPAHHHQLGRFTGPRGP